MESKMYAFPSENDRFRCLWGSRTAHWLICINELFDWLKRSRKEEGGRDAFKTRTHTSESGGKKHWDCWKDVCRTFLKIRLTKSSESWKRGSISSRTRIGFCYFQANQPRHFEFTLFSMCFFFGDLVVRRIGAPDRQTWTSKQLISLIN